MEINQPQLGVYYMNMFRNGNYLPMPLVRESAIAVGLASQ
jgi:hypothetical protein